MGAGSCVGAHVDAGDLLLVHPVKDALGTPIVYMHMGFYKAIHAEELLQNKLFMQIYTVWYTIESESPMHSLHT